METQTARLLKGHPGLKKGLQDLIFRMQEGDCHRYSQHKCKQTHFFKPCWLF